MLHLFCIVDFILNASYKCKYVTSYIYQAHHLTYLVSLVIYFSQRGFSSMFHCNGYTSVKTLGIHLSCLSQDFMTTWSLITLTCWIPSSFICMDKSLSTQADAGHCLIRLTDGEWGFSKFFTEWHSKRRYRIFCSQSIFFLLTEFNWFRRH